MTKAKLIKAALYFRDVALGTLALFMVSFAIHTVTYSY